MSFINAQLMNAIPYSTASPNSQSGYDFLGVSGIRVAQPSQNVSLTIGFQIVVLSPLRANSLKSKIEVEYQSNVIKSENRILQPPDAGRHSFETVDIWGWTQVLSFRMVDEGLYTIHLYLNDVNSDDEFADCQGITAIYLQKQQKTP